jgi:monoamine oxidase
VLGRRGFLGAAALAATTVATAAGPARAMGLLPAADESVTDASQDLARQLLLVGDQDADLKLRYLRILIDNGLPKTTARKKTLIVCAGVAGRARRGTGRPRAAGDVPLVHR